MRTPVRDHHSTAARRTRRRRVVDDPRRIVAIVGLALLGLGTVSTVTLTSWMDRTSSSVRAISSSIAVPKGHLLEAERSNDAAQAAFAAAVASTGDERTKFLAEAIQQSQVTSAEWRDYESAAVGLPGEADLAARYVENQAASNATSSAALQPLLDSQVGGTLPQQQVESYEAVRADLIQLHSMYRQADRAALEALGAETDRAQRWLDIGTAGAFALLVAGIVAGIRFANRAVVDRTARSASGRLAAFEARLRRALELVDNDADAFAVASRAVAEMMPEVESSLLTADSSRARLTPLDAPPTCGVTSPEECPALRSGSTVSFDDSGDLDACRTLARNTPHPCSATCVPITINGRGAAVMHLVGRSGQAPESRGMADLIARSVGDRVTLLQALATFQLQAERDPLTSLLNRRSLETAVEALLATGRSYAVAFADLDHFKRVNDLHGHEAGDRALRAFSRTLTESVRPNDLTCRWGGEEFLVVMPDCDADTAVEAMERVRTNLALGSIAGQASAVTASYGIADSTEEGTFEGVVVRADAALRHAKDTGRNRVVHLDAADPPLPSPDLERSGSTA